MGKYDVCDAAFGKAQLTFLKNSGEALKFIPIGSPVVAESKQGKGTTKKAYFAVITENGLAVLPLSPMRYRQMRPLLDENNDVCIEMVRIGDKGELNTKYTFNKVVPIPENLLAQKGTCDCSNPEQLIKDSLAAMDKESK